MPAEFQSQPQGAPQPGNRGYEPRDASAKWVFGSIGLLALLGLGIHLLLGGMLGWLNRKPPPTDAWRAMPGQVRAQPTQTAAAFPPLQVSPPADLLAFKAREEEQLHSYGWINRTAGVVRIPIEKAMEMVLQKGLPTRQSNQDRSGPSSLELMQQRARPPQAQEEKK